MKNKLLFLFAIVLFLFTRNINAQMILEYDTNLSDGTTVYIPLYGAVNVTVDWGDGSSSTYTTEGRKPHYYETEGVYTVSISGTLTKFGIGNSSFKDYLVRVLSFGDIGLTDLSYAFYYCRNLTEVPSTIPSSVVNMSNMFYMCSGFNSSNICSWDVSKVTDMPFMFYGCPLFNQDIGNWDVSNVTNMGWIFGGCFTFNQDIGIWDVSNVTFMYSMFEYCYEFNQDIGNWDVSNVTNMSFMFVKCYDFNQDIKNWDVSSVTDMTSMFNKCYTFNQDIGSWDVTSVTIMSAMFYYSLAFNQNIGNWNVSNVTTMSSMFFGTALSTSNYDSLLIGWSTQTLLPDINFHGGASKYSCSGESARETLTGSPNNWTITDGGLAPDETAPIISSTHNNLTIDAETNCEASLPNYINDVSAIDNCDSNLDVTQTPAEGTIISGATNTVTLIVTDDAGNYNEVSFNVSVEDNTNPTITCIENQTINLQEWQTLYTVLGTEFDPTESSDNCDGFSIANDFNDLSTLGNVEFPIGLTTVVWTITDVANNETQCSFNIQVNAFVGIEMLKQNGISIYPNPTYGIINLEFADDNILKLTISDITGKQIIEKSAIEQNEIIDLSSFVSGFYIISIQTENEKFNTKIVKR